MVGEPCPSLARNRTGCVVRCASSVIEVCSLFIKKGDVSLLGPGFPKVYYCPLGLLSRALLRTCFALVLEEVFL